MPLVNLLNALLWAGRNGLPPTPDTLHLGCSNHLHFSHHFLSTWDAVMLGKKNFKLSDTRLNMQAQARQHNECQLQPVPSFRSSTRTLTRTVLLLPLLSNIGKPSESPSLDNSTVLLTIKHCYSIQQFALQSEKKSSIFCQISKMLVVSQLCSYSNHVHGALH